MGCYSSKAVSDADPQGAYFATSKEQSEKVAVVSIPINRPDPGAPPDRPAGLGLKVSTLENTPGARITAVHRGGTAEAAGIRVGDVIVEIDGRDVLNASHATVLSRLRSSAESVRLVVVPPHHKMLVDQTALMHTQINAIARSKSRHASTSSAAEAIAPVTLDRPVRRGSSASKASKFSAERQPSSARLYSPTTSGWHVKMEGMLLKSKRSEGFRKSVSKRYFLLKVEPISLAAELEYYDGRTLKGAMTLQGAAVMPGAAGSFVLHGIDRTWYMRPAEPDMQLSLAWIKAIQRGIARSWQRGGKKAVSPVPGPADQPQPSLKGSAARTEGPGNGDGDDGGGVNDVNEGQGRAAAVHVECPTPVVPTAAQVSPYPGGSVVRVEVPPGAVPWTVELPSGSYTPPDVVAIPRNVCVTFDGRCPPVDPLDARGIAFCVDETGLDRTSYAGRYTVHAGSGRPVCPWGRTGMAGRGAFARWGPNHHTTLVLTRHAREAGGGEIEETGFEFLCVATPGGEWALPEGVVPPSERHTATAARLFRQAVLSHACCPTDDAARDLIGQVFEEAIDAYVGCLCDAANTDNAWAETTAVGIHDATGRLFAGCAYDAKARWVKYGTADADLGPTHALLVQSAHELHGEAVVRRRGKTRGSNVNARRSKALSQRFPSEEDLVAAAAAATKAESPPPAKATERPRPSLSPANTSEPLARVLSRLSQLSLSGSFSSHDGVGAEAASAAPAAQRSDVGGDGSAEALAAATVTDLNEVLRQRCLELIHIATEQAPEIAGDEHWLYVAKVDYVAEDDDEFTITKGDELLVHRKDEDGWWLSSRIVDGMLGYLPSNHLLSVKDSIRSGLANDRPFRPSFHSLRAKQK